MYYILVVKMIEDLIRESLEWISVNIEEDSISDESERKANEEIFIKYYKEFSEGLITKKEFDERTKNTPDPLVDEIKEEERKIPLLAKKYTPTEYGLYECYPENLNRNGHPVGYIHIIDKDGSIRITIPQYNKNMFTDKKILELAKRYRELLADHTSKDIIIQRYSDGNDYLTIGIKDKIPWVSGTKLKNQNNKF